MELSAIEQQDVAELSPQLAFTSEQIDAGIPDLIHMCHECHISGATGDKLPGLNSVLGRRIAGSGYMGYSQALLSRNKEYWTRESLNSFLEAPNQFAAGTSMAAFAIADENKRALLIEYMEQLR